MSKLYIVLLGLKHTDELFTEVNLLRRGGVILRDDMRIPRNGIDDDRRIINPRPANLDSLSAIINNDHLFDIHLALEILATV